MTNKLIRECTPDDFDTIFEIINDSAKAYKGIIPPDRWHEPYMPLEELRSEIESGVIFWGLEDMGRLVGVMGIQHVKDVTLIRHAYVRTSMRGRGAGSLLLSHLFNLTIRPLLIGTWADAQWAVSFYVKHGYRVVAPDEKTRLLRKYWSIPERQIETSVVLVGSGYTEALSY